MTQGWWGNESRPRSPGHFRRSQRNLAGLFSRRMDEVERRLRDEADFVREAPSPILRQRTLEAISRAPRVRRRRYVLDSPVRSALWTALAATIIVAFGTHFSQSLNEPQPVQADRVLTHRGQGVAGGSGGLSIDGPAGLHADAKLQAEMDRVASETQRAARALLDRVPFVPDPDN